MKHRDVPIQRKLMTALLTTSGAVLLLTCASFFAYEFLTYRQTASNQLATLGEIIASNSTAALAFDAPEDANEVLAALRAERHIVAAGLYDKDGNLFSMYPADLPQSAFPKKPKEEGSSFSSTHLISYQRVMQGNKYLGTLYIRSDMGAMYDRLRLYAGIAVLVIIVSFLLAYFLSIRLQKRISTPILALAETAKAVSNHSDYSVRAVKLGKDEIGLLTDAFNQMLTQIQEQNAEITAFNHNLEHKVTERTLELEVANKELEAFSYSVSHDLRAPLRAINSYTKILEEDHSESMDADGKNIIGVIIKNSKKMGELIDDLLAFSRLGKKELNSGNIDMNHLVKNILDDLPAENKQEIVIGNLPSAAGDLSLLRQVWVNLISNAIKYSQNKSEVRIEIGAYQKENKNIYYVKDNGVGFDMKYYDKLFGVFQRLHSQEDFEGTGVGLAIVNRIIQKHNGQVWAESKVNEGATFYFSLRSS